MVMSDSLMTVVRVFVILSYAVLSCPIVSYLILEMKKRKPREK